MAVEPQRRDKAKMAARDLRMVMTVVVVAAHRKQVHLAPRVVAETEAMEQHHQFLVLLSLMRVAAAVAVTLAAT